MAQLTSVIVATCVFAVPAAADPATRATLDDVVATAFAHHPHLHGIEAQDAVAAERIEDAHTQRLPSAGLSARFYTAGDRVKYWGKHGAFWGAVFGILIAPAAFFIPGIGPILTGGIIGSLLMGAVEGAVVGAVVVGGSGAIAAALVNLGLPAEGVVLYEAELKADKFLLIATGSPAEVERARGILAEHNGRATVHAR